MSKKSIFLLLLSINLQAMSQTKILGEYFFRQTEMVAGFNFSAAGTFRFYLSYGAVDRSATGTFLVEGNTIKLKSNKEAGKDFTINEQSKKGSGYTIRFTDPNKYLLQNIVCIFFVDGEKQELLSDSKGEVHSNLPRCDSIYVKHLLYPDIVTLVKDAANDNNNFSLALNPSLEQVSFKGIDLKIENDHTISCLPNYFLDMPAIKFVKND